VRHLQNKFDGAIAAFREAVRLNSSLWTSHLFLGIGLYRTNQFPGALASIGEADRLAPKANAGRDDIDYWLGAARIALKQHLSGLQSLERLLTRNPKHAEALELATRTYAELNGALWSDVAERHFESPQGYEVHGNALEGEGNRQGALEAHRQSKALAPNRPGPGLAIGRLLLLEGNASEAWAALRDVLRVAPGDAEASYYAGLALIQLGRYEEAAPPMETAARWALRHPEAPIALAQIYLALDDSVKAVEAAGQAAAIAPDSQAAHDVLVAALRRAGKSVEARREEERWRTRERR